MLVFFLCPCWLGGQGCERSKVAASDSVPDAPAAGVSASASQNRPAVARAPKALGELRRGKLRLPPLRHPSQSIGFWDRRLFQLEPDQVRVYETTSFSSVVHNIKTPRALALDPQQGVSVVGREGLFSLSRGQTPFFHYAAVTFLPGSQIFPDLLEKDHVWVYHENAPALYRYHLVPGVKPMLPLVEELSLPASDGVAFLQLKDGTFAYTARDKVVHVSEHGSVRQFSVEVKSPIVRLAKAPRVDRLWALCEDHDLVLLQFDDHLREVKALKLGREPLDIAVGGPMLAAVFETVRPKQRQFEIVVYDAELREVLRAIRVPQIDFRSPDWAERLSNNHGLALSEQGALLALGGPERLAVWDVRSGKLRFEHPVR